MRTKQQPPTNFPTLVCSECGKDTQGYERLVADSNGVVTNLGSDIWPAYFRDIEGVRVEFCGAECGLRYCQKNALV